MSQTVRQTPSPTLAVLGPELGPPELVSETGESEPPDAGFQRTTLADLLECHFRSVWRALRRFGIPAEAADDAAQEVFIIASRKLEQIEAGRERQFLVAVALRVAANARRARAVRPDTSPGADEIEAMTGAQPTPETLVDRKRARELLDAILDSMPDDLRAAFVLFELEGYTGPEVAELLEIPLGTASSRLRRAREIFQTGVQRLKRTLGAQVKP